jgi:diaminopimelate epimerase
VSALAHNLSSPISVSTRGGKVSVQFQRENTSFHTVVLEGEANIVYRGKINE